MWYNRLKRTETKKENSEKRIKESGLWLVQGLYKTALNLEELKEIKNKF